VLTDVDAICISGYISIFRIKASYTYIIILTLLILENHRNMMKRRGPSTRHHRDTMFDR
jgi:hypothetical protein